MAIIGDPALKIEGHQKRHGGLVDGKTEEQAHGAHTVREKSLLPGALYPQRQPAVHHSTSEPLHFFGRAAELAVLERSLLDSDLAVVALVGPGGQGKTAIVQHW